MMIKKKSTVKLIDKIKKKYSVAMARGILVVDENIESLTAELEKLNIRIITVPKGTSDPDIIRIHAANRIIVTNNVDDFKPYASSFDMGIIAVKKAQMANPKKLAKRISDEIIKHQLWSIRYGFLLTLNANGKSTLVPLTD